MTDAVMIKMLETVPMAITALGTTITAVGGIYAARFAWQAKKVGEIAVDHAKENAATTQKVQERQIEIKSQTDGQLSQALAEAKQWREFAQVLMAIMSAREGKPITAVSQVVRADDPLVKRGGNGNASKERRTTDLKLPEPDEEPSH